MSSIEQDQMAHLAGRDLSYDNENPRIHEGFLLPEDWHFSVGVEKITPKVDHKAEVPDQWGNILTRWTVHMSDGVKLGMNYCEPKQRSTDTAILETPAWLTNLHGFNEFSQRSFGSLGIPSILIGHIGQERQAATRELGKLLFKPWRTVRELRSISLARQAHNMLEIHQYAAESFQLNANAVFLHGNSRGAMVQFPELAIAKEKGIHVPFAMPVAPCFAKGFGKETAKELRQAPITELWNAGRLAAQNLFDLAKSGFNTLNVSPKAMVYEAAHTESLFNGDAGRFDNEIDINQNMLILAYRHDLAGMYEEWQRKFEGFPNVYVRDVPGAHLSIADKRTSSYVLGLFEKYADQLRDGTAIHQLDHSHVRRPLRAVE